MGDPAKKFYILDTNVLLHDPMSILAFVGNIAVVPTVVLGELDSIKERKDKDVSREAMIAIRNIERVLGDADPDTIRAGVPVADEIAPNHGGMVAIFSDDAAAKEALRSYQSNLQPTPDNLIIGAALHFQSKHEDAKVVLVTKDINMRLMAKGFGLRHVEDYRRDQVTDSIENLSKGYVESAGFLDQLTNSSAEQMPNGKSHLVATESLPVANPRSFIVDVDRDYVGYVSAAEDGAKRVLQNLSLNQLMNQNIWGIKPRNLEQALAVKLLVDPNVDMVVISGPAGSGKTLLALASALQGVIEEKKFDRIILTRTTDTIGEPIGFLPGTEEEKMRPLLGAFTDALEFLHSGDDRPEASAQYALEKGNVQFRSVTHMRGRSYQRTFIVCDEAQNCTPQQMKAIVSRVGAGSKLVVLGNLAQIDNKFVSPLTSGLAHVIERSRTCDFTASIYVNGVERSRLAEFAESCL